MRNPAAWFPRNHHHSDRDMPQHRKCMPSFHRSCLGFFFVRGGAGGRGKFSPIMSEVSSPAIPQFQGKSKSLLSQIHLKLPNFSIFSWFSAPVGLLVLQVNSNLQLAVLLLLALAQRLITLITFRKHSTLPCKENPSREQALVAAWRAEIKGCHLGLQSPRTYDWRYGIFELQMAECWAQSTTQQK